MGAFVRTGLEALLFGLAVALVVLMVAGAFCLLMEGGA